MATLHEMLARIDPATIPKITNRHMIALCILSERIGVQTRTHTKSIRLDLTFDPDALRECASAGLALLLHETYGEFITLRLEIQEALPEWQALKAFQENTSQ